MGLREAHPCRPRFVELGRLLSEERLDVVGKLPVAMALSPRTAADARTFPYPVADGAAKQRRDVRTGGVAVARIHLLEPGLVGGVKVQLPSRPSAVARLT